jgi:hypothetical protein
MDDDLYFPCIVCSCMIHETDYNYHISICNMDNENRIESQRVYRSSQIPTGLSLRNFVREHFNIEPSSSPPTPTPTAPPITQPHTSPITSAKGCKNIKKHIKNIGGRDLLNISDTICSICHDALSDKIIKKLRCQHLYCQECITKWLSMSKKCPMCNYQLEDPAVENK